MSIVGWPVYHFVQLKYLEIYEIAWYKTSYIHSS